MRQKWGTGRETARKREREREREKDEVGGMGVRETGYISGNSVHRYLYLRQILK
jgi:hypothetical protein